MKQLLEALEYCHSKKVVHRDIKPENVLFKHKHSNKVCLVDFGMGREFTGDFMSIQCGSPSYVAPEVLLGYYTEKCDIWSSGVLMYILLTGVTPFYGSTDKEILARVAKGVFSMDEMQGSISQSAQELVCMLIEMDTEKRLSAKVSVCVIFFRLIIH